MEGGFDVWYWGFEITNLNSGGEFEIQLGRVDLPFRIFILHIGLNIFLRRISLVNYLLFSDLCVI